MMEKFDLKTKVGMIYLEVLFLAMIIAEEVWKFNIGIIIAAVVVAVASMYIVDRIALKKGCAAQKVPEVTIS